VDVFLACFGGATVVYPTLSLVDVLFPASAPPMSVSVLTFVLAFGASYPFVAGGWSLRGLGEFVFLPAASAFAWGALVLGAADVVLGDDLVRTPVVVAVAWVLAFGTVVVRVHGRERRTTP
jgi:hypothetical protein